MAVQLFTNNATSTVSGSLAQGVTTIVLAAGTGARFPAPSAGDFCYVTLFEKNEANEEELFEVVKVTARVADTLTVVRDIESMTGNAGGYAYPSVVSRVIHVELRWTAGCAANMAQTGSLTKASVGLGNVDNTSDANKPVSTATQTALDGKSATSHNHTGVYEPADATILKAAAIGVSVQAYDADLTSWAALAPSTKQDTLVSGTSIKTVNSASLLGSGDIALQTVLVSGTNIKTINSASILGSGNIVAGDVTLTGTETLTNKTLTGYTETQYSLTGTDLAVSNGTIQYKTLSGNTTFTESLADGQGVILMLNPSTFTTTWFTCTWIGTVASTAPTLIASVYNCLVFFQMGGTLYGRYVGRV